MDDGMASKKPKKTLKNNKRNKNNNNSIKRGWINIIVAIWLCTAGIIAGIEFGLVKGFNHKISSDKIDNIAMHAGDKFKHRFSETQKQTQALAQNSTVIASAIAKNTAQIENTNPSINDNSLISLITSSLPYVSEVRIIPWDRTGTEGLKKKNFVFYFSLCIFFLIFFFHKKDIK